MHNPRLRRKVVSMVVDEMRNIKAYIPMKAFRYIAKKILDKFPQFFKDVDEDDVELGDGTFSLVNQLYDHLPLNPSKNRKSLTGCYNWGPSTSTSTTDEETLKNISKTTKYGDCNYTEILEKTYAIIRNFLNAGDPTIFEIKKEWPILFSSNSIFWHFQKLTGTSIHFLDQLKEKSSKILKTIKYDKKKDILYERVGPELEILVRLSEHFKEDINLFYVENKTIDIEEIKDKLPLSPFLLKCETTGLYHVFIEREIVNMEGYNNLLMGFKVAFAMYFILNPSYPKKLETTL
ncbi:unnamed protein product [Brassicogethes aeneus]|uniref:Uncharacterized protein n=1 Tax=Brassicogethes aeneus TaxID=1431903 RepID=A0A9P0FM00_BRAAE|nr:unnamed protein product [Brassicogethes aeneus]